MATRYGFTLVLTLATHREPQPQERAAGTLINRGHMYPPSPMSTGSPHRDGELGGSPNTGTPLAGLAEQPAVRLAEQPAVGLAEQPAVGLAKQPEQAEIQQPLSILAAQLAQAELLLQPLIQRLHLELVAVRHALLLQPLTLLPLLEPVTGLLQPLIQRPRLEPVAVRHTLPPRLTILPVQPARVELRQRLTTPLAQPERVELPLRLIPQHLIRVILQRMPQARAGLRIQAELQLPLCMRG